MNFEFSRTLRNFTRRFRRNFDMRIFLNSSRLPKEFLENKICHVMNASLGQIKLRNLFLRLNFLKCNLMHF
jgi:hypothetical protein